MQLFRTVPHHIPMLFSAAARSIHDFHGSLYPADRPCAWSSFAMLLAIGRRFEAHYYFPVLILVVVCQFPVRIIPPGAHQVRTGVFPVPPSLIFYSHGRECDCRTRAIGNNCYLQQLTIMLAAAIRLESPSFHRKVDCTNIAQSNECTHSCSAAFSAWRTNHVIIERIARQISWPIKVHQTRFSPWLQCTEMSQACQVRHDCSRSTLNSTIFAVHVVIWQLSLCRHRTQWKPYHAASLREAARLTSARVLAFKLDTNRKPLWCTPSAPNICHAERKLNIPPPNSKITSPLRDENRFGRRACSALYVGTLPRTSRRRSKRLRRFHTGSNCRRTNHPLYRSHRPLWGTQFLHSPGDIQRDKGAWVPENRPQCLIRTSHPFRCRAPWSWDASLWNSESNALKTGSKASNIIQCILCTISDRQRRIHPVECFERIEGSEARTVPNRQFLSSTVCDWSQSARTVHPMWRKGLSSTRLVTSQEGLASEKSASFRCCVSSKLWRNGERKLRDRIMQTSYTKCKKGQSWSNTPCSLWRSAPAHSERSCCSYLQFSMLLTGQSRSVSKTIHRIMLLGWKRLWILSGTKETR